MKKMILFSVMTTFLVCSSFSILGTETANVNEIEKYGWIPEATLFVVMMLGVLALFFFHFKSKRKEWIKDLKISIVEKEVFWTVVSLVVLFLVLSQMNGAEITGGITWGNILLVIFIPVLFYNVSGLIEKMFKKPAKIN